MTLATIVLATATVSARHVSKLRDKPTLAKSFEADPDDWSDEDDNADCACAMPIVLEEAVAGRRPSGK